MENLFNLRDIFDKKQKSRILIVIILLISLAFFELIGISLFLPLIGFLIDNNLSKNFISLEIFSPIKEIFYKDKNINFALMLIFLIFLVKFIFINLVNIYSNNVIFNIQKNLKNKLFKNYLNRSYMSFISDNASYAVRTIVENSNQLTFGILRSVLNIFSEIFLLLFVLSFLIFLNPKSAIIVFSIFGISSLIFLKFLKKKLIKWGEEKNYHSGEAVKILQESLKGFKEIKISNLFNFFFEKFKYHNKFSVSASRKQVISSTLPQYYLELIAIFSFSIFILSLNFQGVEGKDIIAYLGVYSIAAFKILPSINRLVNSLNTIRFGQACIINISDNIKFESSDELKNYNYEVKYKNLDKINFKSINFNYDKTNNIFENLNLELKPKNLIGVFGESGSGKSTLINLLCGLLRPKSGDIFYNNISIFENLLEYQKKISVVPQEVFILDDTIMHNIAIGIEDKNIDLSLINECLKKVNLHDFVNKLPNKHLTRLGENGVFLSGGQKQRIGIARAIYKKSEIIIFDESTNSLDEKTEDQFIKNIKVLKSSALIIFITHKKKLSAFFDKSYLLSDKKLKII